MDIVRDALYNGVDDSTKEAHAIVADHSITGEYAVRVLEQAARFRGLVGRSVPIKGRN